MTSPSQAVQMIPASRMLVLVCDDSSVSTAICLRDSEVPHGWGSRSLILTLVFLGHWTLFCCGILGSIG